MKHLWAAEKAEYKGAQPTTVTAIYMMRNYIKLPLEQRQNVELPVPEIKSNAKVR